MKTLYLSQQGCYVSLKQETLNVKRGETLYACVQLPLLEQILVFGQSQLTTQVIRACLWRDIPIAYLSRMGYCYGRMMPIERGYRHLRRYQQELSMGERLTVARSLVAAKLKNSRVVLLRQQRKRDIPQLGRIIPSLERLAQQAQQAIALEQLMGYEGAGAAQYFEGFGDCLTPPDFSFVARSKRPPLNPVNALLSFGYQVLWNHLLSLIELQGLDPYCACFHQGTERHAALASDLIEEFRAPLVDSLVMYLINRKLIDARLDFEYRNGGCFLNDWGRKKYLQAFLQQMEKEIQVSSGLQPKWDLLNQQVKAFKQFIYQPSQGYQPYRIN
ncbi:MAG: CRISPR-associated endonuclease Cas1 [Cyanobacteriota bacterium]|nr:CRISPR-associated endonuclease Cas1 [Cyanobacteriota bacterium]